MDARWKDGASGGQRRSGERMKREKKKKKKERSQKLDSFTGIQLIEKTIRLAPKRNLII